MYKNDYNNIYEKYIQTGIKQYEMLTVWITEWLEFIFPSIMQCYKVHELWN